MSIIETNVFGVILVIIKKGADIIIYSKAIEDFASNIIEMRLINISIPKIRPGLKLH
jgi:hypothetical protein